MQYKKTEMMLAKVRDLLTNNNYLTTKEIMKLCNVSAQTVYHIIRRLRLEGVGIIPTSKGYVLSESAQKKDDVGFIRRCFGRRTSDIIALKACEGDIKKRWTAVEDKNNISNVFEYLSIHPSNEKSANSGVKYLLDYASE